MKMQSRPIAHTRREGGREGEREGGREGITSYSSHAILHIAYFTYEDIIEVIYHINYTCIT